MDKIKVLNIDILAITKKELLQNLKNGVLVTPNVDHLVRLQKDKDFFDVYQNAEWVICDSTIIQLFSKLLPKSFPEVIQGSSFFPSYYWEHRDDETCRIFLLGAKEGVAEEAMRRINQKVGREIVVGCYSPSFSFEFNEDENKRIYQMIRESRANVVLVGVGCPKQEKWIYNNKNNLPEVDIWMALGATIDFEAGFKKRAPKVWQKLRIEWFYRMVQEPKRIAKRVFQDLIIFYYWGKQLMGTYKNPFEK